MSRCAIDGCPNEAPRRRSLFCSRACYLKRKREDVGKRRCRHCKGLYVPTPELRREAGRGTCSVTCKKARRSKLASENATRPLSPIEWYFKNGWQRFSAELRGEVGSCGRCGATDMLCVHHKVDPFPTRSVELLFDLANLEVLCSPCHARHHHRGKTGSGVSTNCKRCGMVFDHAPSQPRIYCTRECDFAARREGRRAMRKCLFCPIVFYPENAKTTCCSPACGMKLSSQKKQAKRPEFVCPTCKTTFKMSKSQAARDVKDPCCSRSCAQKKRCAAGWNPMRAHQEQLAA